MSDQYRGGERNCQSKVSCPTAQGNYSGHSSNLESWLRVQRTDHQATAPSQISTSVKLNRKIIQSIAP